MLYGGVSEELGVCFWMNVCVCVYFVIIITYGLQHGLFCKKKKKRTRKNKFFLFPGFNLCLYVICAVKGAYSVRQALESDMHGIIWI